MAGRKKKERPLKTVEEGASEDLASATTAEMEARALPLDNQEVVQEVLQLWGCAGFSEYERSLGLKVCNFV